MHTLRSVLSSLRGVPSSLRYVISQVRQDQEIPACVEVYVGLTGKSSGSRPQGVSSRPRHLARHRFHITSFQVSVRVVCYILLSCLVVHLFALQGVWTDFAISEMMVKARQLFWASEEAGSEPASGRSRLADAAEQMLTSAGPDYGHAGAAARNSGAFPAVDVEPYEVSSTANSRCDRLAAAAGATGSVVVGSAATATRQMPAVRSRGTESRGDGYDDNGSDRRRKVLDTSGPVTGYRETMKNFWFPVAFTKDLDEKTMVSSAFLLPYSHSTVIYAPLLCLCLPAHDVFQLSTHPCFILSRFRDKCS